MARLTLIAMAAAAIAGVAHAQSTPTGEAGPSAVLAKAAPATPAPMPVKRGYWFYEKPPAEEPDAIKAEPVKPMPAPPPEAELLKMHPTQVSKLIEEYRQYALYTMKPENVTWYYQLQDFARRRSRAFMNVTEMVMLNEPTLNMNTEYPTNVPGSNARVQRQQQSIDTRLERERDNAALVLLTTEGCGFCEAQRSTLKYFQQRHGWSVREFDIQKRPDIAAKFGTTYTPTTVVIFRESGDWFPVAVGVESVPKLEENTYRAVRQIHGEATPEQFTMQEYQEGGLLDPTRR